MSLHRFSPRYSGFIPISVVAARKGTSQTLQHGINENRWMIDTEEMIA